MLFDFLAVFGTALLLITFAFSIGAIYKAIDVMAKGLPVAVVGKFFLYNLPYALAYAVPVSALFSSLLLFGRLSSDSEISAMKSGGLSLWQIASPILLFSWVLAGLCLYNLFVVYPNTTYETRKLLKNMGVEDPIKLLEEGRFIRDIPGFMIYVGKKNGNRVKDLIVYEVDSKGEVVRTVRADSGIMTTDQAKELLKVDLFDVRIEDSRKKGDSEEVYYVNLEKFPYRFSLKDMMGSKTITKKRKNMTVTELIYRIRNPESDQKWMKKRDMAVEHSKDMVELHQRICLGISPLMFVLVAIPLGIKSHRKESSAGMLVSLVIMFVYYIFIILSDTFDKSPQLHPWLLPWVPIVLGQIGGLLLLRRAD
ncbi:LptF/LptG family permease [Pontiella sp.]|uniref:LptF/LptG family permease n=1 Tax=Pontiella sp. TaxID=2837462 RepID=UPI003561CC1F